MCELIRKSKATSKTGWKVVVKKNDKYYSLAMGFQYKNGKNIPVVKSQRPIIKYFVSGILTKPSIFRENMKGRTAVFTTLKGALCLFEKTINIKTININFNISDCEPKIVIVRVKIEDDLMNGDYKFNPIVAGRKMTILNEYNE